MTLFHRNVADILNDVEDFMISLRTSVGVTGASKVRGQKTGADVDGILEKLNKLKAENETFALQVLPIAVVVVVVVVVVHNRQVTTLFLRESLTRITVKGAAPVVAVFVYPDEVAAAAEGRAPGDGEKSEKLLDGMQHPRVAPKVCRSSN